YGPHRSRHGPLLCHAGYQKNGAHPARRDGQVEALSCLAHASCTTSACHLRQVPHRAPPRRGARRRPPQRVPPPRCQGPRLHQGTADGRRSLAKLLKANKRLNTVYLLKESFGQLWDYQTESGACAFFTPWTQSLKWQRLTPYETFTAMIDRHWDGIASYCHPENKVSLGLVEGLNNKIRVLQRRAYGYRDEDYLKLKIVAAFLPPFTRSAEKDPL
ncbi:MAG TPA: transposase, partial [Nitrospiraceae bacterium]|nr:transposase [Nitrospiraceae bacterium]